MNTKKELDNIYDQKAEGIRIRSRCKWYKAGEKSRIFFKNPEKRYAQESFITSLYENGELINNMRNIANERSPGNDGFTKEFYETFWDDIKRLLTISFKQALKKGELSTSQKQAVIKLIEKKGKYKR